MKVCSGGRVGARGGVLTRQARVARVGTKPAARQGRRSQGHHSEEHGRQQKIVRAFALAEDGAEEATEEENLGIFGKASDATFELKFVWGKDVLAFAVDQVLGKGNSSPLTEYFFWPQDDAVSARRTRGPRDAFANSHRAPARGLGSKNDSRHHRSVKNLTPSSSSSLFSLLSLSVGEPQGRPRVQGLDFREREDRHAEQGHRGHQLLDTSGVGGAELDRAGSGQIPRLQLCWHLLLKRLKVWGGHSWTMARHLAGRSTHPHRVKNKHRLATFFNGKEKHY